MEFTDLPEAAQRRAISLAARALTSATAAQIPRELAAVARFSTARRARRGASQLRRALESDAAFRALVAARGLEATPTSDADPDESADGGGVRSSAVEVLVSAYLRGVDPPPGLLEREHELHEVAGLRSRLDAAQLELERLRADRERARPTASDRAADDGAGRGATADSATDLATRIERLTGRLREQGTRLREALDRAAQAEAERDEVARRTSGALEAATAARDAAQQRATVLAAQVDQLRAVLRQDTTDKQTAGRVATRRVELLLEAAQGAIAGLQSEWSGTRGSGASTAAAPSVEPADVVARRLAAQIPTRQTELADSGRLVDALGVPRVHLVVDGYNVTKSGFGHLTLAEQRERLVRALGLLVARTGAEATVVFDGAAVVAPVGQQRGVRVLFSPAGVLADDVIRELVDAEPVGRPLVVVTSDRAVRDDVVEAGATVAASTVLLAALRG